MKPNIRRPSGLGRPASLRSLQSPAAAREGEHAPGWGFLFPRGADEPARDTPAAPSVRPERARSIPSPALQFLLGIPPSSSIANSASTSTSTLSVPARAPSTSNQFDCDTLGFTRTRHGRLARRRPAARFGCPPTNNNGQRSPRARGGGARVRRVAAVVTQKLGTRAGRRDASRRWMYARSLDDASYLRSPHPSPLQ
ncbi:hypothetical protein C8J57DRAFT_1241668 [Mycena rebaudengoi]|nr:hypothetical protein C8J57DRAFT_1241668 [Mycena rebaudengoi]